MRAQFFSSLSGSKSVCHWRTWGRPPQPMKVLDALRCIIRLIQGVNELFQMKFLPVLRKPSIFFTLSWCAGLSACGTMALRPGVWGPLKAPRSQEGSRCSEMQTYLRPFFFLVCRAVWPEPNYFFSWRQSSIILIFFTDYQGSIIFFEEFPGTIIFFNSIHPPPPPPPPPPPRSNGQCLTTSETA